MSISNRSCDRAWLRGGTTDVTNARTCHFSFAVGLTVLPFECRPRTFTIGWGLCEYGIVRTILGGSPVILWISLGGKPKWLPLEFGYHDVMRTSPILWKKIYQIMILQCSFPLSLPQNLLNIWSASMQTRYVEMNVHSVSSSGGFVPFRLNLKQFEQTTGER